MTIFSLLKYITSHPLTEKHKIQSVIRFLKWQINTRINPYPIVYPFTEKAKLIIKKGMTGATGNLYCGLHEYNDMSFLLHFLRADDLFVDIGANIGSYTVLASGHVGANTISIEPVPSTYAHLSNNIAINQIGDKVAAHNMALGAKPGTIAFTSTFDTMNRVAGKDDTNTIEVGVETLDRLLNNQNSPALLKIDVEGFETEVINGASNTLSSKDLKAVIIELNGSGAVYGFDEKEIHNRLISLDFKPYNYDPRERSLIELDNFGANNTIYIRDLAFVHDRVKTAPKIKILNTEI